MRQSQQRTLIARSGLCGQSSHSFCILTTYTLQLVQRNANSFVTQLTTIQHTALRVRERIIGKDTLCSALASPLMLISRWCMDTVHECLERVVTACSPLSVSITLLWTSTQFCCQVVGVHYTPSHLSAVVQTKMLQSYSQNFMVGWWSSSTLPWQAGTWSKRSLGCPLGCPLFLLTLQSYDLNI